MKKYKATRSNNGKIHSFNDEPAVVKSDGSTYWYRYGKYHRETNAAVIRADGTKEFWLNEKRLPLTIWLRRVKLIQDENKLELMLEFPDAFPKV